MAHAQREGCGDTKRPTQYPRDNPLHQRYGLLGDGNRHTKGAPRNPRDDHARAQLATVSGGGANNSKPVERGYGEPPGV